MDPNYSATLTINGEVVSDEVRLFKNGSVAIAYVWSDEDLMTLYDEFGQAHQVPRDPGWEVAAELESVTEEKGGRLMGVDRETGKPATWVVQDSDRPCRGCS